MRQLLYTSQLSILEDQNTINGGELRSIRRVAMLKDVLTSRGLLPNPRGTEYF